jgi:hypothetical protein
MVVAFMEINFEVVGERSRHPSLLPPEPPGD